MDDRRTLDDLDPWYEDEAMPVYCTRCGRPWLAPPERGVVDVQVRLSPTEADPDTGEVDEVTLIALGVCRQCAGEAAVMFRRWADEFRAWRAHWAGKDPLLPTE